MSLLYSERSLDFDGSNDWVDMGNTPELDFEHTDPFSTSCWFKNVGMTGTVAVMGKRVGTSTGRGYVVLVNTAGVVNWVLRSGSGNLVHVASVGVNVNDGNWHHICCTYDGSVDASGATVYVDGEETTTIIANTLTTTLSNSASFALGSQGGAILFEPIRVDEAAVYDKELTPSEVTTIYNGGLPDDLTVVGPTGNLVGYWPVDGDTFPTVTDQSVNSNDGTMTNMAADDIVVDAPRPREVFYSYLFGGVNEYITMGNIAAVSFERTDAFSASVWIKTHSNGYILAKQASSGSFTGWGMNTTNDKLRFRIFGSIGQTLDVRTVDTYRYDEWVHFAVMYDGSSNASGVTFVINGSVASFDIISNDLASSSLTTAPFTIGCRNTNDSFIRGAICEASVWDRELTLSEVQALYNSGRPKDARTLGISSNLVGYWPLSDRDSFPTVPDLSSSGNDGTATNMEASDIKLDAPGIDFNLPSVSSRSIEFEGSGRVVISPASSMQFERTDSFSCSAWFKTSSTSNQSLLGNLDTTQTGKGWEVIMLADGTFRVQLLQSSPGNELIWDSDLSYNDDVWHHLVVTYPGDELTFTLYIDGVLVPFTPLRQESFTGSTASSQGVSIGGRNYENLYWTGNIDDIAIYNRVLTEVEVRTLYGARGPTDILELLPVANLIGYWRLGDHEFSIVPDLSGNGNDGEMLPELHKQRIVNDRPPGAASTQFANGTDGVLTVNDDAFNFSKTDSFSLCAWVRTTSGPNQYPEIIKRFNSGTIRGYVMGIEGFTGWPDGGYYFMLANNNPSNIELYINTNLTYNDGTWHHIVATYDGSGNASGMRIYVDGSLAATTIRRNTLGSNDFDVTDIDLEIKSATNPSTGAEGAVCQVAVYNKELTTGEVTTIYNGGTPTDLSSIGPTANLEGYWPIVDTDIPNLPVVADVSGNGRDVTAQDRTSSIFNDAPKQLTSLRSIDFDGSNDYLDMGGVVSELNFDEDDPFSVLFWMKSTDTGTMFVYSNTEGTPGYRGYEISIISGQVDFALYSAFNSTNYIRKRSTNTVNSGDWVSVCITYDGSSSVDGVRIYINAIEESAFSSTQDTLNGTTVSTEDSRIGGRPIGSLLGYDGQLDGLVFYNRVLSPSEVFLLGGQKEPVDHGAVGPVDALLGWWRMGDGDTFPTISDNAVAYDNDGTMTNMVAGDIVENVASANYYSMRGIDDPGPGYETWVVNERNPDFDASESPGAIVTDSAVVTASWNIRPARYLMRALADPGPGYVTWIAENEPDFDGSETDDAIQAGTAVSIRIG